MLTIPHCKIRVTPENTQKVQEICFKNNVLWENYGATVHYVNNPFLYVSDHKFVHGRKIIKSGVYEFNFEKEECPEITASDFIEQYQPTSDAVDAFIKLGLADAERYSTTPKKTTLH